MKAAAAHIITTMPERRIAASSLRSSTSTQIGMRAVAASWCSLPMAEATHHNPARCTATSSVLFLSDRVLHRVLPCARGPRLLHILAGWQPPIRPEPPDATPCESPARRRSDAPRHARRSTPSRFATASASAPAAAIHHAGLPRAPRPPASWPPPGAREDGAGRSSAAQHACARRSEPSMAQPRSRAAADAVRAEHLRAERRAPRGGRNRTRCRNERKPRRTR